MKESSTGFNKSRSNSFILETFRHCFCQIEGTLNHLIVQKINKKHEKIREIFPVKDSYVNIWEEL